MHTELVERYPAMRVLCLVRSGEGGGDARLRRAVSERWQWSEAVEVAAAEGRVQAVRGSLGSVRFGMDQEEFESLARSVDVVYHCGSWVDHLAGYETLKAVNVGATTEIIRMARVRGAPLAMHYISTMSVLERGQPEDSHGSIEQLQRRGGYCLSKWVAECRLREAARQVCCC